MKSIFLPLILGIVFGLAGCAVKQPAEPLLPAPEAQIRDDSVEWASFDPDVHSLFVKMAEATLGIPYVYGGTTLKGFDCSGLVQWAYRNMGVNLPRTAREQSAVGREVAKQEMSVGDIVAFRIPRRGYHTGIYMGNGQFVHSPSKRKHVKYSSLEDPYFKKSFIGARRVTVDRNIDLVSVEERIALATGSQSPTKAAARKTPLSTASIARGTSMAPGAKRTNS